jgi:hypothetical protein
MFRRSLALLALGLALAAPTREAAAGCCSCAIPCWAPAPITIWGLSPAYGVNQGPVYSGPGYTTLPTYEGEASTIEYPYVGYEGGYAPYPPYRTYRPYDGGPYADPLRHHIYHGYWGAGAPSPYPAAYRHGFYRHVAGPRVLTVSVGAHGMPHVRRISPDWQDR